MRLCFASIVLAICLLLGGCSAALQMQDGGATPARDAARCIALASTIGLPLQVHETDRFLVLSAPNSASATTIERILDQVCLRFYEQFDKAGFKPRTLPDKLVWVCFDSYDAFEAYGRKADGAEVSWMDAYYSHRTNRVAMTIAGVRPSANVQQHRSGSSGYLAASGDPGAGHAASDTLNVRTITHELTHQLAFNSGLQRRGAAYPFWLTEGLATNFEADGADGVALGREDSRHRQRLIGAKRGGNLIAMEEFVGMTQCPAGQGAATREAYAQAWGFFRYLLETRPAAFRKYLAELSSPMLPQQTSASLRSRFVAIMGPIKPLEEGFLRFIDKP